MSAGLVAEAYQYYLQRLETGAQNNEYD